jgi:hypothetical protein
LSDRGFGAKLHHRDVVGVALRRLEAQLHSEQAAEVLGEVKQELSEEHGPQADLALPGGGSD